MRQGPRSSGVVQPWAVVCAAWLLQTNLVGTVVPTTSPIPPPWRPRRNPWAPLPPGFQDFRFAASQGTRRPTAALTSAPATQLRRSDSRATSLPPIPATRPRLALQRVPLFVLGHRPDADEHEPRLVPSPTDGGRLQDGAASGAASN